MSGQIHVVYSRPPEGVTDEEFNAWYDRHVLEILAVPGFAGARRFEVEPLLTPEGHGPYRYAAFYEIAAGEDPTAVVGALDAELRSGRMELPEWFGPAAEAGCFVTSTLHPLAGRVVLA